MISQDIASAIGGSFPSISSGCRGRSWPGDLESIHGDGAEARSEAFLLLLPCTYTHQNRRSSQVSYFGRLKPPFPVLVPSYNFRGPQNNKRREHQSNAAPNRADPLFLSPNKNMDLNRSSSPNPHLSIHTNSHSIPSIKPPASDLDPPPRRNRKLKYQSAGVGSQAGRVDGYKKSQ